MLVRTIAKVFDPAGRKLRCRHIVNVLNVLGSAAIVLATDVKRQQAALATSVNQSFGNIKVALLKSVLFEHVAPAAGANSEIECRVDLLDTVARAAQLALVAFGISGAFRPRPRRGIVRTSVSIARPTYLIPQTGGTITP